MAPSEEAPDIMKGPPKPLTFQLRGIYGVDEDRALFIRVLVGSIFQKQPDMEVALKKCWVARDDLRTQAEKIYFDVYQGMLVGRNELANELTERSMSLKDLIDGFFGDEKK